MKRIPTLCLLLSLVLPFTASALLSDQLEQDFGPLDGHIIIPAGDEYLINLDASTDLKEGDILTLVKPGEKVFHPVTKEVLGSIDLPRGYLQITRIESGYSYAKLLYSEDTPLKGDQVKRYKKVPTRFISINSDGAELYKQLQAELPQLDWRDEGSAVQAFLIFTLEGKKLTVTTLNKVILYNYILSDDPADEWKKPETKYHREPSESQ